MMFARMVSFAPRRDAVEELVALYQSSVIPAATEQKGFRGATLLTDRANARATSITFWESEADLLQSEKSGYFRRQLEALREHLVDEPVRTVYEVSAQTVLQTPASAGETGLGARR